VRLFRLLVAIALLAAAGTGPAGAQVATAPELKAAFLFNFVRFTTWPADALPAGGPIAICVLGDRPVAQALEDFTRDQHLDGHAIVVRRLRDQDAGRDCHLLYASDLRADREARLIAQTRGAAVLTASDSATFMQRGGIAAFHLAAGRMRFSVNPSAAKRARLQVSSRLLGLAVIVDDDRRR